MSEIKGNLHHCFSMKKTLLIGLILAMFIPCQAMHIVGGEMLYTYLGPGTAANTNQYLITLKLFRNQNVPANTAPMPTDVFIGIFNNDNGAEFQGPSPWYDVIKSEEDMVPVDAFPPCIVNPPSLDYHVGIFLLTVDLPQNATGYTATYQTCCRVSPITNVSNINGNQTGSTYTCAIPAIRASSPEFSTSIDAICGDKPFTLNFSATDSDGDSLSYAFSDAYGGGLFTNAGNANPAPPPYASVPYFNGYGYNGPLGNHATINSHTGIISGIAPDVGRYVVGVSVFSYRNGVLIAEHRKDFIINVTACDFAGAVLNPMPVSCNGFNVSFSNDDFSPLNLTSYWDFGDPASGTADTSTSANPVHIYSDTGLFVYKLVVNRGLSCSDSATQRVGVYPGFFPGFTINGKCKNSPILFIDTSKTNYGLVNSWSWNFGDPNNINDTSHLKDPTYSFADSGYYPVQLTITSTKGCVKAITDTILILNKPVFSVTDDTLICSIDTLQLKATGTGSVFWTPDYNINNQGSFNPLVSPKVPTTYYATLVESPGCTATDSVRVNVVNKVSLDVENDTTICLTDTATLTTVSDGLHYLWTPSATIINDTSQNPMVIPTTTTTYHVVASIGKCHTPGDVTVRTVPYPKTQAGEDTTICFSKSYQLFASGGSIYLWSPPVYLNNPNVPDPITTPAQSIRYIVQVNDVLGCPKPIFDTVLVNVQNLIADAGPRDTSIVVNQPLQLNGTGPGADSFIWTPSTGLNNPDISDPISLLSENQQYVLNIQSEAGCTASDTIEVLVYKVKPGIYVPNAFTPNGDGLNDIFKPILIGMKSLLFFRVYDRAGELMYSTNIQGQGWDGTFKGKAQDAAVFVWTVQGVDYQGYTIFDKGVVMLVR